MKSNDIDSDRKHRLLKELCEKYPNYKPHLIGKLINQFNCDIEKINEYIRHDSIEKTQTTSSDSSMRRFSDDSEHAKVYTFISMNSDNSGYSSSGQIFKSYRSSSEINKISLQKTDLQKLDEAFKKLEKHRDFLNREALYMGEVIERRKSELDFPTGIVVDSLDKVVNKKYSMPAKSISYANDLRQPGEMNRRFAGFHGVYNQYPNNDDNNNNNNQNYEVLRRNPNQHLFKDQMNPNLYHSPQNINSHLEPFRKQNEKRYSAHYDQVIDPSHEVTVRQPFYAGHYRQRSDPWVPRRQSWWHCPQCDTDNNSSLCSFCEFNPQPSNSHR